MYTSYSCIKLRINFCNLLCIGCNLKLGNFYFQFLIQLILSKLIGTGQLQTSWVGYCGWIHLGNLCWDLKTLWRVVSHFIIISPFIISPFITIIIISVICRLVWRWLWWWVVGGWSSAAVG